MPTYVTSACLSGSRPVTIFISVVAFTRSCTSFDRDSNALCAGGKEAMVASISSASMSVMPEPAVFDGSI